jgi:hypothetical protein
VEVAPERDVRKESLGAHVGREDENSERSFLIGRRFEAVPMEVIARSSLSIGAGGGSESDPLSRQTYAGRDRRLAT